MSSISTFTEGMTNGAGYLAVTAVILGSWRNFQVLAACLLFGSAAALQVLVAGVGRAAAHGSGWSCCPYVLALLAVTGLVRRSRAPAALTLPFSRGSH